MCVLRVEGVCVCVYVCMCVVCIRVCECCSGFRVQGLGLCVSVHGGMGVWVHGCMIYTHKP